MCDLFDKNMNLVPHVFNCYFKYRRDIEEDLLQEGYTELWRVANNFDASKGKKFSTYAITCIIPSITIHFNSLNFLFFIKLINKNRLIKPEAINP